MEQEVKQANRAIRRKKLIWLEVVRKLIGKPEADTENYRRVYGTRGISGPV